ncbi:MAG: UDP-glucose/GDP-mannose dehydrogenase family protein [Pseudomonadota bacterium]
MKITMIGTGYVGLVSGACFSEFGFNVTCVDQDAAKIEALKQGVIPIYEPGLDRVVEMNASEGRLDFTTDLDAAVGDAKVVFVAVGTPSRRGDGEADLQYVHAAARQIARAARPGTVIVIKSTVVVGTTRAVRDIIAAERPDLDFSIAMNPEFLREGSAIEDFMRPDRVVIGVEDERAETALRRLYRPLNLRDTPIVVTSLEDAELAKYASNAFLAMKVTFINEVADLCEQVGGNVQDVAKAMGLDNRIGAKFLHAGPGFGGSCFPKDTRAFAATGQKFSAPQSLVEQVVVVNDTRRADMAQRILDCLDGDPNGKTVGLLGIAFKPNTDDIREAPSLDIVPILQEAGLTVKAHDPAAMEAAKSALPGVVWCETPADVADQADAVAILTEWNAYRALDLEALATSMRAPVLLDFRNIYKADEVTGTGLTYRSIGRPELDRHASATLPRLHEDAAE